MFETQFSGHCSLRSRIHRGRMVPDLSVAPLKQSACMFLQNPDWLRGPLSVNDLQCSSEETRGFSRCLQEYGYCDVFRNSISHQFLGHTGLGRVAWQNRKAIHVLFWQLRQQRTRKRIAELYILSSGLSSAVMLEDMGMESCRMRDCTSHPAFFCCSEPPRHVASSFLAESKH